MSTVCFTGRRPKDLCGYNKKSYENFVNDLEKYLEENFCKKGYKTFISGGAQGFDQLAFWAVNRLKKKYPDIKNIVYVPFEGQETKWAIDGLFSQKEYKLMLSLADNYEYLYKVNKNNYSEVAGALIKRNNKMVDDSDCVIALYPDDAYITDTGGTSECMRYAVKCGKPVYQIKYKIQNNELDFNEVTKIISRTAKIEEQIEK